MHKDWVVWAVAVLLFGSGALAASLAQSVELPLIDWSWLESRSGLAIWIQSLGSICAVFSAIYIASSQKRAQIASERSAKQMRIATLRSLCISLKNSLKTWPISDHVRHSHVRELNSLAASFNEIDLLSLPEPELVGPFAKLKLELDSYTKGFKPSWTEKRTTTQRLAEVTMFGAEVGYFHSQESREKVTAIRQATDQLINELRRCS